MIQLISRNQRAVSPEAQPVKQLITNLSHDCPLDLNIVILVMLDLSAAFDTIDHDILFSRMENTLGITSQALAWFKSYLSGRTLRIKIDKSFSELQDILWYVPQGSVLGPLLFLTYLLPLGKLIRKHG